ncbi:hypothetical protein WH50_01000 [Pokkaliibacter plantistimulans]|uniref:Glycosyltransferase subfamily 4-like N-terminal domain-containing protein n=1 Tax=Pokkaliibacter plantistimulans TaxID=1635171 RepID=A0ABX5M894_9GAMM|nr:glycosyltransferase family 4 protein [Pokkaliibacter plantistimulans]PXF33120.1 hypothetical protein WH50_01000 [Pokkaliibacter plantistimulans]
MRIAYLDPHRVPDPATESLQILQTVDGLAQAGANVYVITPQAQCSADSLLGRQVHERAQFFGLTDYSRRWWHISKSNRLFYRQALAWLRKNDADAILVRNLKLAERILKEGIKIPLIFETHEIFSQTYREEHVVPTRKEQKKLHSLEIREAFVYQHASGILTLTQALADDIQDVFKVDTPIHVAPDGVDLQLAAEALKTVRQPNHEPVMLYLGSLHPWKGVETLIRAMPLVPVGRLWIAGGGELRIAELKHLATQLEVLQRVDFLGPIDPLQRFELIAQADICLLPLTQSSIASRYTSPLKLFEYMAMGKAIISADVPSIREVLTTRVDALLCDPEDIEVFAELMSCLVLEPSLCEKLGNRASSVAKGYSWLARAEGIVKFISGLNAV